MLVLNLLSWFLFLKNKLMDNKIIYGIQQLGVGVDDVEKAFKWYGTKLGADVCVFDDNNEATYMAPYMGGKPRDKRAILALNIQGGSGYELWQHTGRKPLRLEKPLQLGDLGINIAKVKSKDIVQSHKRLTESGVSVLSDIKTAPDGKKCFYIQDPFDNIIQIKECDTWYQNKKCDVGGMYGCMIGVSDIDASLKFYADVLGYNKVLYDTTQESDDFSNLPKQTNTFRRVLLQHEPTTGGFSKLFGISEIELIQAIDYAPKELFDFKKRFWGDVGYIHLCFDIHNMDQLIAECKDAGFPFTVLSSTSFDMGEANGRWGYLEDPDGILIEFVETFKVPIVQKIGLAINLQNRNPKKNLPDWLIKAMAVKRKKF